MSDISDIIDITYNNINDIISQESIDIFIDIGDIGDMKKEIDFHKFALRVPEELYKAVEDLAWKKRTSVNIQIIDLLIIAIIELAKRSNPTNDAEKDYLKQILESLSEKYDKMYEGLSEELNVMLLFGLEDFLKNDYLEWRNK